LSQNGYARAMRHLVAAAAGIFFRCEDYREGFLATDTTEVFYMRSP